MPMHSSSIFPFILCSLLRHLPKRQLRLSTDAPLTKSKATLPSATPATSRGCFFPSLVSVSSTLTPPPLRYSDRAKICSLSDFQDPHRPRMGGSTFRLVRPLQPGITPVELPTQMTCGGHQRTRHPIDFRLGPHGRT